MPAAGTVPVESLGTAGTLLHTLLSLGYNHKVSLRDVVGLTSRGCDIPAGVSQAENGNNKPCKNLKKKQLATDRASDTNHSRNEFYSLVSMTRATIEAGGGGFT